MEGVGTRATEVRFFLSPSPTEGYPSSIVHLMEEGEDEKRMDDEFSSSLLNEHYTSSYFSTSTSTDNWKCF